MSTTAFVVTTLHRAEKPCAAFHNALRILHFNHANPLFLSFAHATRVSYLCKYHPFSYNKMFWHSTFAFDNKAEILVIEMRIDQHGRVSMYRGTRSAFKQGIK